MTFPKLPTMHAGLFFNTSEDFAFGDVTGYIESELSFAIDPETPHPSLKFVLTLHGSTAEFYAGDVLTAFDWDVFQNDFLEVVWSGEPQDKLNEHLALICQRFVERDGTWEVSAT